jgi:TolB-like protein/lipoprotein NlpI
MGGESAKPANTRTGAVFLSYASQDADAARRICDALRASGIEVWFDQSELRGGDVWDRQIRAQIHECRLFMPIVSANSEARVEGYFRREWKLAVDRTHDLSERVSFLVPVVIDSTSELKADVPDAFRHVQWTRLPGGEMSPAFAERVRRLLTHDLPSEPAPATHAPPASGVAQASTSSTHAPPLRKPAVWVIAAAVALVIAFLFVNKYWSAKHALTSPATSATATEGLTSTVVPEKSIAVLPFADMSERHDQEYFGDGMADEIINILGKIPELKVIGRTSSFQFKGKSRDLREMGTTLGAAYIVEGSVRRSGDHVRVTSQLIDARTAAHIWSDSYDRELGDVLRLQSQIATSVARALQLAVGADDTRTLSSLHSTEAYTLYLRGRYAYDGPGDIPEAQSDYEQALALDPNFLRVAEAQAWMYAYAALTQEIPARIAWQHAKESADRALGIDGNSAPAHAVVGLMHAEYEYDWEAADAEFTRALSLNPRDPMTLDFAARVACHRGRYEEALRHIDAALAVDPLNARAHRRKGFILYFTGDDLGAEREYRKSLEIVPSFNWDHLMISWILVGRGDLQQALNEAQAEPVPGARDQGLSVVSHALGRHAESDAALLRLTREFAGWPTGVALAHAYRKEPGQAFEWLDKAYSERDADLLLWVRGHPFLQPLRGDPRYKALMGKMNMRE